MCVAIAVPVDVKPPDLDILKSCEDTNPDGGGFARIIKNNKGEDVVKWDKGLDATTIFELMAESKPPYLIHFRIATAGGNGPELTHPFPISKEVPLWPAGTCGAVMIHNGHWDLYDYYVTAFDLKKKLEGPISDSRVMAYLLNRWGNFILPLLKEKIAILNHTGGLIISQESRWTRRDGVFYSNMIWDYRRGRSYEKSYEYPRVVGFRDYESLETKKGAKNTNINPYGTGEKYDYRNTKYYEDLFKADSNKEILSKDDFKKEASNSLLIVSDDARKVNETKTGKESAFTSNKKYMAYLDQLERNSITANEVSFEEYEIAMMLQETE